MGIETIITYVLYGGGLAAILVLIKDMKNTKSSETMFYSRLIIIALVVGFIYSVYFTTVNVMGLAWVLATVLIAVSVAVNKIEAIAGLVDKIRNKK